MVVKVEVVCSGWWFVVGCWWMVVVMVAMVVAMMVMVAAITYTHVYGDITTYAYIYP